MKKKAKKNHLKCKLSLGLLTCRDYNTHILNWIWTELYVCGGIFYVILCPVDTHISKLLNLYYSLLFQQLVFQFFFHVCVCLVLVCIIAKIFTYYSVWLLYVIRRNRRERERWDCVNGCTRFDEYFAINRNICVHSKHIKCPMFSVGWLCVCVCLFFSVFVYLSHLPFFIVSNVCVYVSSCSCCYCLCYITQSSNTTIRLEIFYRWFYQIFNVYAWDKFQFLTSSLCLHCPSFSLKFYHSSLYAYMQIWRHTHTYYYVICTCMYAWCSMNFMCMRMCVNINK